MTPFELTEELIAEIIFGMENQDHEWLIDVEERCIVSDDEVDPEELNADSEGAPRFVPIPEWESADGFRLLERFVDQLRNEEVRARLRIALSARRGVFRLFKDTIAQYPFFERRWHAFKEQEMRAVVAEWYNDLRVAWGLEPIEVPEEPSEELLLTDVSVRVPGDADVADLEKMRHAAREELVSGYPELGVLLGRQLHRAQTPAATGEDDNNYALIAEAAGGGLCGFVLGSPVPSLHGASTWPDDVEASVVLEEIFVWPEYRGLGIGRLLLERFLHARDLGHDGRPLVSLMGSAVVLAGLVGEDFETVGIYMRPRPG
ncbi:MAG: GNAT family N-acetyltransferase [Spirochaetaceae bacterium]